MEVEDILKEIFNPDFSLPYVPELSKNCLYIALKDMQNKDGETLFIRHKVYIVNEAGGLIAENGKSYIPKGTKGFLAMDKKLASRVSEAYQKLCERKCWTFVNDFGLKVQQIPEEQISRYSLVFDSKEKAEQFYKEHKDFVDNLYQVK